MALASVAARLTAAAPAMSHPTTGISAALIDTMAMAVLIAATMTFIRFETISPAAPPIEAPLGRLSSRQRDVLDQMARGRANKEIAQLLGLSPSTVKTHVAHIIAVVGASNRTEAATRARDLGLV